jgi:hypothetical protein
VICRSIGPVWSEAYGIEENTKDIRDVNDRKYRGLTFATGEWRRTNNVGKEPHRKEGTTLNQLNTKRRKT